MKVYLRSILICIFLIILSAQSLAVLEGTKLNVGYVGDVNGSTPLMLIENDWEFGDFIVGTIVGGQGERALNGYESFILSYFDYDDSEKGFYYGPLKHVKFGYGLLLNDLNTLYSHPIFLGREQSGIQAYFGSSQYTVDLIKTYGNLQAINLRDIRYLGFEFGFSYAGEDDGLGSFSAGHKPYTYMQSMNISYPLLLKGARIYTEFAQSSNDSSGSSVGLSFDRELFFLFANLKIEARSFDPGFIPGYFDSCYELNPINMISYEALGARRDGTYASASAGVLGFLGISVAYENYVDSFSSLSFDMIVTPVSGLDVTGYFKQPTFKDFRYISDNEANLFGGGIMYKYKKISFSVNYKKAPIPGETTGFETTYLNVGYAL